MQKTENSNKKVSHLIQKGSVITWNPPGIYFDTLWICHIGKCHTWPKGYWIKQYNKKYVCIQIILDGDMKISYNKQTYIAKAGDCVIQPPGDITLRTGASGFCQKIYLIPTGVMFKNAISTLKFDKLSIIHDFSTAEFNALFEYLCALHKEKEASSLLEISTVTYKIIMYIAAKIRKSEYPEALNKCLNFIDSNISEKLTLDEIGKFAGIGKTVLKSLFNTYLEKSPGQYIINLRMNQAVIMLENEPYSIKYVASACGYENPLYFSNAFKKHFGYSPRNYLKEQMNVSGTTV